MIGTDGHHGRPPSVRCPFPAERVPGGCPAWRPTAPSGAGELAHHPHGAGNGGQGGARREGDCLAVSALRCAQSDLSATRSGSSARRAISPGGFHNHQASRAVDALNAAAADLCALATKLTARLLDGAPFGLPKLLVREDSAVIGTEFLAWSQTSHAERARQAAVPAVLTIGLEDPGGGSPTLPPPSSWHSSDIWRRGTQSRRHSRLSPSLSFSHFESQPGHLHHLWRCFTNPSMAWSPPSNWTPLPSSVSRYAT